MNDKVDVRADRLEGVIADTAAIQAVDLLTSDEIELLRGLVAASDVGAYVNEVNNDEARKGMLAQLCDLGFVSGMMTMNGDIAGGYPTPKAAWAIARYDKRVAVEKERRDEEEKRKTQRMLAGFVVGFASGVLAPVLASVLKGLVQSAGLPLA